MTIKGLVGEGLQERKRVEPGTDEQASWRDNLGPEFGINKGPKSHQCPYCPYNTNFTTHLQTRVEPGTEEQAGWRDNLGPEFGLNKGPKSHQCPYCPYNTNFTTHLQNHVRTHTGEKPYQCQWGWRVKEKELDGVEPLKIEWLLEPETRLVSAPTARILLISPQTLQTTCEPTLEKNHTLVLIVLSASPRKAVCGHTF
ncbi:putative gastrula zinc finger protein XlCGF57.1-like isoform X5 [Penaeus vannamei]|uniref:Putative gastrula zinc finger protein XlCGF57.1-like isoform X5 n=1 Tax=Penaeus vannamei TaxID=6689 RepID=A0A423U9F6_PENVA|nr:putative gastrula zinc finger protein XlCGF57.1-like isoform X5 [Penaeus vannamei]